MMHQDLLSHSEALTDPNAVMCLFWDLEARSTILYQQMADCEKNPLRAEVWRRIQDRRLILGDGRAENNVYLSLKLLSACEEMIRQGETAPGGVSSPFSIMASIIQTKFLQTMLVASLRQQAPLSAMLDLEAFSTTVAYVTDLILKSRT